MVKDRKRRADRSGGSDMSEDAPPRDSGAAASGSRDAPLTEGRFAELMRGFLAPVNEEISGIRAELGGLRARVSVLEDAPPPRAPAPSVVPPPAAAARAAGGRGGAPVHRAPAPAAAAAPAAAEPHGPPSGHDSRGTLGPPAARRESRVPTRLEITNCHDYDRRFDEALDCASAATWIRTLVGALRPAVREHLLPLQDILRRNSRALVFIPTLYLRHGLEADQRIDLMSNVRDLLGSGAHDVRGRRPRARWEHNEESRKAARVMALTRRLCESLSTKMGAPLERFIVQSAGRGTEVWYPRDDGRPRRIIQISVDLAITPSELDLIALQPAELQEMWDRLIA